MTDSQSQTRRRFLKGSAAAGGLVAIAGCGSDDGGSSGSGSGGETSTPTPVPFPKSIGVHVSPAQNTLQVAIWFKEPVKEALDDRGLDAAEIVTFSPTVSDKKATEVDTEAENGYLTRISARGVVSHNTVNDASIVSSPQMKIHGDIQPADAVTPASDVPPEDKWITFSVESTTKADGGSHLPDDVQTVYEFPFKQTYSQLGTASAQDASETGHFDSVQTEEQYRKLWAEGYNSTRFPKHFPASLENPSHTIPATAYYNEPPFLTMQKLVEAKQGLYEHLIRLVHKHDQLDEKAWQSTRALVGEAMYAATGVNPDEAAKKPAEDIVEVIGSSAKRSVGLAFRGATQIAGIITAYGEITKAGEKWTDNLMTMINSMQISVIMDNVTEPYENTQTFANFEEKHLLPALTLGAATDKNISRRDVHRFYDKHLDAERAALYDLFPRTQTAALSQDWRLYKFNRGLLYITDDNLEKPDFVDTSQSNVKLNGETATPDETDIAALSPKDAPEGRSVVDEARFKAEHMGYVKNPKETIIMANDGGGLVNNVPINQPVGEIYRDIGANGRGAIGSDDSSDKHQEVDRLRHAMYFTHLAETIDMILNITRLQQIALQEHTNLYPGKSLSVDTSNYTATLNNADIPSRKVYTALTRSGGEQDPGTGVAYTMISTETGLFNFHKLNSAEQPSPKKYVLDRDYKHSDGKLVNVLTTVTGGSESNVVRISSRYKNAGNQRFVIGNPSKNVHDGDTLVGSPWISEPSGEYRFHIAGVGSFSYENTSKWETFNPPTTDSDVPPFVTTYDDNLAISLAYLGDENDGVMVLANAKDGLNGDPVRLDYTVNNMALEPGEEHRREVAYAIHEGGENAPQKARELFKQL